MLTRGQSQAASRLRQAATGVDAVQTAGDVPIVSPAISCFAWPGRIIEYVGEAVGRDWYRVVMLSGATLKPTGRQVTAIANRDVGDLLSFGDRVTIVEVGGIPPFIAEGGGGGAAVTISVTFAGVAPHTHQDQLTGGSAIGPFTLIADGDY